MKNDPNSQTLVEKTIDEFKNDLSLKCILFDGAWGIGKTYQVAQALKKEKYDDFFRRRKIVYISLSGKSSIDQLNNELFSILHPQIAKRAMGTISQGLSYLPGIGTKVGQVSYGLISALDSCAGGLENKIRDTISKYIVILDDLERKNDSLSFNEVFGYINSLSLRKVRVICICNTDCVKGDERDYFEKNKEKTFGKIIKLTEVPKEVYCDIFQNIPCFQKKWLNEEIVSYFHNNIRLAIKTKRLIKDLVSNVPEIDKYFTWEEIFDMCAYVNYLKYDPDEMVKFYDQQMQKDDKDHNNYLLAKCQGSNDFLKSYFFSKQSDYSDFSKAIAACVDSRNHIKDKYGKYSFERIYLASLSQYQALKDLFEEIKGNLSYLNQDIILLSEKERIDLKKDIYQKLLNGDCDLSLRFFSNVVINYMRLLSFFDQTIEPEIEKKIVQLFASKKHYDRESILEDVNYFAIKNNTIDYETVCPDLPSKLRNIPYKEESVESFKSKISQNIEYHAIDVTLKDWIRGWSFDEEMIKDINNALRQRRFLVPENFDQHIDENHFYSILDEYRFLSKNNCSEDMDDVLDGLSVSNKGDKIVQQRIQRIKACRWIDKNQNAMNQNLSEKKDNESL